MTTKTDHPAADRLAQTVTDAEVTAAYEAINDDVEIIVEPWLVRKALEAALCARESAPAQEAIKWPDYLTVDDLYTLRNARTFIDSREKMFHVGVEQYDDLMTRIEAAFAALSAAAPRAVG